LSEKERGVTVHVSEHRARSTFQCAADRMGDKK
jgi:hypothetical protein